MIGGRRRALTSASRSDSLNERGLVQSSPDGRTVTMLFGDDGSVMMEPPPGPGMEMTAEGCTKGVVDLIPRSKAAEASMCA